MHDQREEDDGEREEDDEIALWKGAPAVVVRGTASATASDTAPRIPLQAITIRDPGPLRRDR